MGLFLLETGDDESLDEQSALCAGARYGRKPRAFREQTVAMRFVKNAVRRFLNILGYDVVPRGEFNYYVDIGRTYDGDSTKRPQFKIRPGPSFSYAQDSTLWTVIGEHGVKTETILYSHLTLLKMLEHYEFQTVLDIGSHNGNCSRIFEFCGKRAIRIEVSPGYEADYKVDYLDVRLPEPVDAIWCSQILEHQRNVGIFLDKVFADLKDGGVLALTVPQQITNAVSFGHLNLFSPVLLIYHLVCAGFDCSKIAMRCYNNNIGVIVKKHYNGVKRLPFGVLPDGPHKDATVIVEGRATPMTIRELTGDEIFSGFQAAFPLEISGDDFARRITSLNWGPII